VTNFGVAAGKPTDAYGGSLAGKSRVRDMDDAVVSVQHPGIRLEKTAGDATDGETWIIRAGSDVVYTYEVVNIGDTYLTNIA
jgi:hypothetical protein